MTDHALLIPSPQCPADRNPALVYIGRLTSIRSRETMLQSLDVIADLLTNGAFTAITLADGWGALRYQHTQAIRAMLMQQYKPATVNKMLSGLRQILKEAWRLGYMSADECEAARDIKNVRNDTLPAGRAYSFNEITALIDVCQDDRTAHGVRDAALLGLLWSSGARRAEVSALDLDSYDAETGRLTIIHGKGGKERATYLDEGAMDIMADWLSIRG